MTWSFRATTLALIFAVCSVPAGAQKAMAFVRGNALLNGAPGINERKALLQRETQYFEAEVAKMTDSLQKMDQAYKAAEATLSPATRDARRKGIEDQLEKFRKTTDSLREVAGRRQDEVLQPIVDAVNKILADFRAEEGYAAIYNLDDNPAIVAFDKNLDITDALLARVKRIPLMPPPPTIIPAPKKIPPGPGRGGMGAGSRVNAPAGAPRPAGEPALTAAEITALVGGSLIGEAERRVSSVAPLDRAEPDQLSFLADKRYAPLLPTTRAGVVLVAPAYAEGPTAGAALIVVEKPYDALVALLPRFVRHASRPGGVHPSAVVSPDAAIGADVTIEALAVVGAGATLGDRAWIGPHCVVGAGVAVGTDTRLISHVTCYSGTQLGNRVTIHAGTVVGSDGFGYAFANGKHNKITHVGRCIIHDDVEIGANSCIDRGSVDDTVIGAGTKIDNLVHVGHNVHIGRLCLLMALVGVAGSTHIEDGAIMAGQSGVTGHVTIGAAARIAGGAGVISDVPAGETWSGYPARPHREAMRATAALYRLSELLKRIERMMDAQK